VQLHHVLVREDVVAVHLLAVEPRVFLGSMSAG
jgi:hypothetical protein